LPPDRLYNRLGQLHAEFLTALEFRRNSGFNPDELDRWVYGVRTESTADLVHDDDVTGIVELEAEIVWSPDEDEPEPPSGEPPFSLSLTLTGVFAWLGNPDDDDAKLWLEVNGEHLLWPYLRAHIASITAASDLPALTIFTLGVPRPAGAEQTAAEQAE